MKAIRVNQFGGPEVLDVAAVDDPVPRAAEVVVRVKAAGVNPYDTYMRAGAGSNNPALPYTPGTDAAGVVEFIGPDVDDLAIGDRVFTTGTTSGAYAELALCQRQQLHRLPQPVSFSQGAGIYVPYATGVPLIVPISSCKVR